MGSATSRGGTCPPLFSCPRTFLPEPARVGQVVERLGRPRMPAWPRRRPRGGILGTPARTRQNASRNGGPGSCQHAGGRPHLKAQSQMQANGSANACAGLRAAAGGVRSRGHVPADMTGRRPPSAVMPAASVVLPCGIGRTKRRPERPAVSGRACGSPGPPTRMHRSAARAFFGLRHQRGNK